MNKDIECITHTTLSPREVFGKINDVAAWWATNVQGDARNTGDRLTVRFGKTYCILEVVESIQGEKIVWKVMESCLPLFSNPYEWNDTYLIWEISSDGPDTKITFTHKGIVPGKDCYADCTNGWNFYITQSLHQLLNTGKGLPGTGIFARIIVGGKKYDGLLYFKHDPVPVYEQGHVYIDVKETKGEEVTAAYAVHRFDTASFDPGLLKGEYYMIVAYDRSDTADFNMSQVEMKNVK